MVFLTHTGLIDALWTVIEVHLIDWIDTRESILEIQMGVHSFQPL